MRLLRVLVAVCVMTGAAGSAKAWDLIPTETGDYCKDEAYEYLRRRFPGVEIASVKKIGSGRDWQMWSLTNLCSGYFVFDYMPMEHQGCTSAQYGSRTEFATRVWGYGDCKRIMPRDEYL